MSYVLGFDAVLAVEVYFKRKDDQHPIDVALQRVHSIAPPRPDLRADVVDDAETLAMKAPCEPHVEVGPVDQHYDRRPSGERGSDQLSICSIETGQLSQHLADSNRGDRTDVDHKIDSGLAHLVSAGAKKTEVDLRIERSQRAGEVSAMFVAAGLSGDDHHLE